MRHHLLRIAIASAVLFGAGLTASEARAQSPFMGPGYGCGLGFGYANNYNHLYGLGKLFVPPYFAVHPPVYYSHPVPRPYGYSPYALWPGEHPAEAVMSVEPVEIINPHVDDEVEAMPAASAGKTAQAPQWIVNPFVEQELVSRSE